MQRYQGQELPKRAKIAVISNDAIGNFVVATPLLQMLRAANPHAEIAYFSGTRVSEFTRSSDLFDSHSPLRGIHPGEALRRISTRLGTFNLVFNMESTTVSRFCCAALAAEDGFVCGPCMDEEGRGDLPWQEDDRGALWADSEWVSPELTQKFPYLKSGFIGEIFCRLAYLEGDIPPYKMPSQEPPIPIPDVLIATSASLKDKLWTAEKWGRVLRELKFMDATVGLIGAAPKDQAKYWEGNDLESQLIRLGLIEDLRGRLTLPQVCGALGKTKMVVTLDNGIMHMALAGGKPVIGLFRHGIHRLWAPPYPNLHAIVAPPGEPVSEIPFEAVYEILNGTLRK